VNDGQPRSLADKSKHRPRALIQVMTRAVTAFPSWDYSAPIRRVGGERETVRRAQGLPIAATIMP